jgi:hypothetical protein
MVEAYSTRRLRRVCLNCIAILKGCIGGSRFLWAMAMPFVGQAIFSATVAAAAEVPAQPTKSTLYSGDFDDFLMLAADDEAHSLSGYYNDGKCRFSFWDSLTPIELYQRRDFGEAYSVQSWDPAHPERIFTTTLYSRARGGYQEQITLEPGQDHANRPTACRWWITLDRSDNVSNSYFGVRVVRKDRPRVFDIVSAGGTTRMIAVRRKPLRTATGVWAARTWSAAYSPAGYTHIAWYDPPGTPQGGYVRDGDLFPLPLAVPAAPALRLGDERFARNDIKRVELAFDVLGRTVIDIELTQPAAARLATETSRRQGSAIDLRLDERVIEQAVVTEPITSGKLRISGGRTLMEGKALILDIACTLGLPDEAVSGLWRRGKRCP